MSENQAIETMSDSQSLIDRAKNTILLSRINEAEDARNFMKSSLKFEPFSMAVQN
ncbi:hypothetical protein [Undibacterium sp. Di24W]|uniref:hypothetical protein n=1 Tax=Undibacterium sp. Di24W TaxID=3413033 RepID=UPI003BF366B5